MTPTPACPPVASPHRPWTDLAATAAATYAAASALFQFDALQKNLKRGFGHPSQGRVWHEWEASVWKLALMGLWMLITAVDFCCPLVVEGR